MDLPWIGNIDENRSISGLALDYGDVHHDRLVVCVAMTTITLKNKHQCPNILPVRDTYGSGLVIEHRCIKDVGHDGVHRDKEGACWVNQAALLRQYGVY